MQIPNTLFKIQFFVKNHENDITKPLDIEKASTQVNSPMKSPIIGIGNLFLLNSETLPVNGKNLLAKKLTIISSTSVATYNALTKAIKTSSTFPTYCMNKNIIYNMKLAQKKNITAFFALNSVSYNS